MRRSVRVSAVNNQPENPFKPSFGRRPLLFVGRGPLLDNVEQSLRIGSGDYGFTRLVLGQRGSGKTTLLAEISERAALNGALILRADASTPGLLDRITSKIIDAYDLHDIDVSSRQSRLSGVSVGPIGIRWEGTTRRGIAPHLEGLTTWAASQDKIVLLTVDEMHAGERNELRRLCADLQTITNIDEMPLAFVGAGLPEMSHTLLQDKKMTFFHRCHRDKIPVIEQPDAWRCLRQTIEESEGTIHQDALAVLASAAADGLAYKLQSLGHYAWRLSGAPKQPIDLTCAQEAVTLAEEDFKTKVLVPMWHDLPQADQDYLIALSAHHGRARPQEIAVQVSDQSARSLLRTEGRLTDAGHLTRSETGEIVSVGPLTVEIVNDIKRREDEYRDGEHRNRTVGASSPSLSASPRPSKTLCNAYMPRAKARCVLPRGHQGRCRSR